MTHSHTTVLSWTLVVALTATAACAQPTAQHGPFTFEDVGDKAGLFPHLAGVRAHGSAFGDITGNGYPDHFVGVFWLPGTTGNLLFLNNGDGTFKLSEQQPLQQTGRATGAVFVDLNNDGWLDLYVSNHTQSNDNDYQNAPNRLFRNMGQGKFVEVPAESGAIPLHYRARAIIPADYDGDGLLDLIVGGGAMAGHRTGLRVLRNLGNYQFEDVSDRVGLPETYFGSSGAVADVTNNGYPDIFFAGSRANRLFLNDGKGQYYEAPGTAEVFRHAIDAGGQSPTGVAFADLTGNGLLDIVVGQHTDRPWLNPISPRLYINLGLDEHGHPRFIDATEQAGFEPVHMKTPQIEVQDFDNDGRPDIFISVVKFDAAGHPHPLIYRNEGVVDGIPRFRQWALGVNDFPAADDLPARSGAGAFFDLMNRNRKITYAVAAPAADYDRDGRMDLFISEWWAENRSIMLRNTTPGGNYLHVKVTGRQGVNRMGIGSKVYVYEPGRIGQPAALIAMREINIGYGYSSGQEAMAHIGLGSRESVDVRVVLPHGKGAIDRAGVKVNQILKVEQPN